MDKLEQREISAWHEVNLLLQQKKSSTYDAAVLALKDLYDLAQHRGSENSFQAQLKALIAPYQRSTAFMRRMNAAGLMA